MIVIRTLVRYPYFATARRNLLGWFKNTKTLNLTNNFEYASFPNFSKHYKYSFKFSLLINIFQYGS